MKFKRQEITLRFDDGRRVDTLALVRNGLAVHNEYVDFGADCGGLRRVIAYVVTHVASSKAIAKARKLADARAIAESILDAMDGSCDCPSWIIKKNPKVLAIIQALHKERQERLSE